MWADDRHWLPRMLRGDTFRGRFLFDDDTMLDHALQVPAPLAPEESTP
jgi:8-oxo-dGTP diphosphatase